MAGAAHCWKWAPEGASLGASAPAALHRMARRGLGCPRHRAGLGNGLLPLAFGAMAPRFFVGLFLLGLVGLALLWLRLVLAVLLGD